MESTVFLIFWPSKSIGLPYDIPSSDDRSRRSAKNTVMPRCEDPSSLFSVRGIGKSNYSQRSCEWPDLKFLQAVTWSVLLVCWEPRITNCWRRCLWGISGKLVATLELCPTLQPIYLSQKTSVPCVHCKSAMDIFLRVPSTEISSNSSTACAGKPQRTALIENTSSNELFVLRRFFHFCSNGSTKIIYKKINNPYHGFSSSWTYCSGIQLSIKCRVVTMSRVILVPSSLTRLCKVQHATTSISSRGNHAITTQCFVLLEKLPQKHIWRTCSNIGTVFPPCSQFICPRRLLYIVCIAGVRWRSSFVFLPLGSPPAPQKPFLG